MKTQLDYIKWWNSISKTQQNEYSLEYYGVDTSYILDTEIENIYYDTQRYYVEFDGNKYLCLFPSAQKHKNQEFGSLEEALNYMLVTNSVKELNIKN